MEITWLPDVEPRPRRVAVGEFDGVHLGHREVIAGADTVVTFEPHPRRVVAPESAPPLLTSLGVKAELVGALGVRELVVVGFDEDLAGWDAQAFVDEILVERLRAERVSVGENFRFGHRARGDVELLRRQTAFSTRVVALMELDGEVVSSSRIRALVATGEVERAGRLLGRPFELRGEVRQGDQRGRALGYPTANLVPDPTLLYPGHGVYACRASLELDGERRSWPAATNVGVRPQFETGWGLLVEAYLLGFRGDLYGRELRLDFLERLRGEKRFESVEALVEQMHLDVEEAARIAA